MFLFHVSTQNNGALPKKKAFNAQGESPRTPCNAFAVKKEKRDKKDNPAICSDDHPS